MCFLLVLKTILTVYVHTGEAGTVCVGSGVFVHSCTMLNSIYLVLAAG